VINATTGGFGVILKGPDSSTVRVLAGDPARVVYKSGTGFQRISFDASAPPELGAYTPGPARFTTLEATESFYEAVEEESVALGLLSATLTTAQAKKRALALTQGTASAGGYTGLYWPFGVSSFVTVRNTSTAGAACRHLNGLGSPAGEVVMVPPGVSRRILCTGDNVYPADGLPALTGALINGPAGVAFNGAEDLVLDAAALAARVIVASGTVGGMIMYLDDAYDGVIYVVRNEADAAFWTGTATNPNGVQVPQNQSRTVYRLGDYVYSANA
jgi:hypothetical protein